MAIPTDTASDQTEQIVRPFDRRTVRCHRDRAAHRFDAHEFLLQEVGGRLVERLGDIRREFPRVLDLGSHTGLLAAPLAAQGAGREIVVHSDLSPTMAAVAKHRSAGLALAADEEALPFAEGSFDLVISNLSLHWVNDLPGALLQIRRVLKPDGLFLAALLGGDTLFELRRSLMEAELRVESGVSPRVSPMADVRDAGNLLTRAGFALPVTDADTLQVTYENAFTLMRDLRGMGETNAVAARRKTISRRTTLMEAAAMYAQHHAGDDGRIAATFQVIYLLGWAPHPDQPKPLRPGSAAQRLADALSTSEHPAGDTTSPGRRGGH